MLASASAQKNRRSHPVWTECNGAKAAKVGEGRKALDDKTTEKLSLKTDFSSFIRQVGSVTVDLECPFKRFAAGISFWVFPSDNYVTSLVAEAAIHLP